jgi:glycosyltransferase involved in cell wall biosynthesis
MKVLILSGNQYPFEKGGGTTYLKYYSRGLKKEGIKYEIWTTKYLRGSRLSAGDTKALGIHLKTFKNFFFNSFFKIPYYLLWYFSLLILILKKRKYREFSFIHAQDLTYSAPVALIFGKIFRKKVYFTSHGSIAKGIKERHPNRKFLFFIFRILERVLLPRFEKVFCISRKIKRDYLSFCKNLVFVPNFIDTKEFFPFEREKIRTIAYIGRLSKEKNIGVLLDSAIDFPKKKILIIGDGPEMGSLKQKKQKLELQNCFFIGHKKNIPKVHKKIDLLVLLCEVEGFGLAALEALASGIPVIAADVNELHYFVGKSGAGIVLKKINRKTLSKAIDKLSRPENLKRCSKNAIKISKRYDYKKIVPKYILEFMK